MSYPHLTVLAYDTENDLLNCESLIICHFHRILWRVPIRDCFSVWYISNKYIFSHFRYEKIQ